MWLANSSPVMARVASNDWQDRDKLTWLPLSLQIASEGSEVDEGNIAKKRNNGAGHRPALSELEGAAAWRQETMRANRVVVHRDDRDESAWTRRWLAKLHTGGIATRGSWGCHSFGP